jgi:hypothetical protein
MLMNRRLVLVALAATALAVPTAAAAKPGGGKGHEKVKKAKTVTFVFKGTFIAPGTVELLSGNPAAQKDVGGRLLARVELPDRDGEHHEAERQHDGHLDH